MDREWSTSALGEGLVGWDWFSLQFDDGHELMYYQLREEDGRPGSASEGVIVGPDGSTQPIDLADVELEVLDTWTSPRSGATYPAAWNLRVPAKGIDLTLTPLVADQELPVSFIYWEGAVRVEGSHSGYGYIELTGYYETMQGVF